jgi:peptidoglycan/xylan/chitin deacetylase (PgdA/CDA1 family)
MSKREMLASVLVRSGLVGLVGKAHSLRYKDVKVLAYHRVLPRREEANFAYDLELVSAWEDEFDWQMAYLARHHEVITCVELARFVDTGKWPSRPCVLVTFDDGYLDNHDVAFPILQRHGIPAVIFVSTGYMGREETFWYDLLTHAVLRSSATHLTVQDGQRIELGASEQARRAVLPRLLRRLKDVSNAERLATQARWHAELGVPTPAAAEAGLHRPMNWQQVKAMSDAGIEIGSHTVSHPVLSRLQDPAELRREIVDSKAAIEAHTGKPVYSLAYPTGGRQAYSDQVMACIRDAGYRFAFTYEAAVNVPGAWDPYQLGRSAVERYVSRDMFRLALAAPVLAG